MPETLKHFIIIIYYNKIRNLSLVDTHANSNRQTRCTTGLERDST